MNVARRGRAPLLVLGAVLVLAVAGALWWLLRPAPPTRITAYFDKAVGLYPGSEVRVLGVEVGKVDTVTPAGAVVRVVMHVGAKYPIPPGADAVVVAPSLVSDRFVQLTPAWVDGPRMTSGAVIPKERTATPVEIDALLRSVSKLSTALGPNGANAHGALSDALTTAAANLGGNGADLNTTLNQLGALAQTLSRSRGNLFATVDNLNKFTATLAASDAQVRDFQTRLADVTGFLGNQRQDLGAALSALASALGEVHSFIKDNRDQLDSNVRNLAGVTQTLVRQRAALSEALDVAPLATSNYLNSYDEASRSVAVRGDFTELMLTPLVMGCDLLQRYTPTVVPPKQLAVCTSLTQQLSKVVPLPSVAGLLGLVQGNPLPAPDSGGH